MRNPEKNSREISKRNLKGITERTPWKRNYVGTLEGTARGMPAEVIGVISEEAPEDIPDQKFFLVYFQKFRLELLQDYYSRSTRPSLWDPSRRSFRDITRSYKWECFMKKKKNFSGFLASPSTEFCIDPWIPR